MLVLMLRVSLGTSMGKLFNACSLEGNEAGFFIVYEN